MDAGCTTCFPVYRSPDMKLWEKAEPTPALTVVPNVCIVSGKEECAPASHRFIRTPTSMNYIKKSLSAVAFISSIGFVPVLLCTQSSLAYGADEAKVEKLKSTRECPGCDLSGAELAHANLEHANLNGANLKKANLSGADLRGAKLNGANLSEANLSGANLTRANLYLATFNGANLRGANLHMAVLMGATFSGAKGLSPEQKEYLRGHDAKYVPE